MPSTSDDSVAEGRAAKGQPTSAWTRHPESLPPLDRSPRNRSRPGRPARPTAEPAKQASRTPSLDLRRLPTSSAGAEGASKIPADARNASAFFTTSGPEPPASVVGPRRHPGDRARPSQSARRAAHRRSRSRDARSGVSRILLSASPSSPTAGSDRPETPRMSLASMPLRGPRGWKHCLRKFSGVASLASGPFHTRHSRGGA